MKTKLLAALFVLVAILTSCSDFDTIKGDQSPMGEVGVTVSSSSSEINGVSNIAGEVVALEDGVSSYTGTATVTDENLRNILANFPGTEIEGDQVTINDLEFKQTDHGLEAVNGLAKGTIVDYDSKAGDEYQTSDGVRTVVTKSTDDDYFWGGMMIKVSKIEEHPNKYGVKTIRYWANHRWGLVGIEFTFDDNTTATFPVYTSTSN